MEQAQRVVLVARSLRSLGTAHSGPLRMGRDSAGFAPAFLFHRLRPVISGQVTTPIVVRCEHGGPGRGKVHTTCSIQWRAHFIIRQ